jgi:glutamine synthetase
VTTGRTLFGAKPPKGHELDDHYFGSIPERVLAFMLDAEREMARLGIPIKTRHNEVAPGQYEFAPVFENSNVGSDHQQLCMQILQSGRAALRPRLPAAREAVRRRQRLGQAQQLVVRHRHGREPARAGRHAAREPAVPVLLHRGARGGRPPPGAAAARRSRRPARTIRLGANEAPPAILSVFLGAELQKVYDAIESGLGRRGDAVVLPQARRVRAPAPADARRRPQPHVAVRVHRQQVRVPGARLSQSPSFPNTVLNTIAAQAIDRLADDLEARLSGGAELAEAVLAGAQGLVLAGTADRVQRRRLLRRSGTPRPWRRGLSNLRQTPDALPALLKPESIEVMGAYDVLSEREMESRYEVSVEQYIAKVNIEAETTFAMAKTMLLPGRHPLPGRSCGAAGDGAGIASVAAEVGGLVDASSRRIGALATANESHPEGEVIDAARHVQGTVVPPWTRSATIADQLERTVRTRSGRCEVLGDPLHQVAAPDLRPGPSRVRARKAARAPRLRGLARFRPARAPPARGSGQKRQTFLSGPAQSGRDPM